MGIHLNFEKGVGGYCQLEIALFDVFPEHHVVHCTRGALDGGGGGGGGGRGT